MSRNSSGTYSLPSGNPVVSGTTIASAWANGTLTDVATALTNSLDRTGQGGMQAPLRNVDGTRTLPAISFIAETGSGAYRAGAQDVRLSVNATDIQQWTSTVVNFPTVPVSMTPTNGIALTATGAAAANAILATGGAGAAAIEAHAGTNATAIDAVGNGSGNGIAGTGGASNGNGVIGTGTGSGNGVTAQGGSSAGAGVVAQGGAGGVGLQATAGSNATGITGTGNGTGNGVAGTGGATNGSGVVGTGNGSGYGVVAAGGSGGGVGVSGTGGGNASGVVGTGAGTGNGVVGTGGSGGGAGGAFAGGGGAAAVNVGTGHAVFTGGNPASSTGFANTQTPANICKAWGNVTFPTAGPVLQGGFNVASVAINNANYIRVTFATALTDTNYSPVAIYVNLGQATPAIRYIAPCNLNTGYFDIGFADSTGAPLTPTHSTNPNFSFQVFGLQ